MSISTVSTGTRNFRRSPSSILSSDSDIRFTRKKLTSQTRCGCCIIALFLTFLLLAGAAVYVGYTYFLPQYPNEQMYRATFKVIEGDTFSPEMADPNTKQFKDISRDYRERLNLLFKRSPIGHGYVGSEVLALDGTEGKDLIIHFIIRIDPTYINIKADNLEEILADEISVEESLFFRNLTIDSKSLEVRSSDVLPQIATTLATTLETLAPTQRIEPARKCVPIQLKYCNNLNYNVTSYPNILEHRSIKDVREDVISFRELVDAECYRYAYDFVCQVLQPKCTKNDTGDDMILPCRNFCRDFIAGCGSRLSDKFKEFLDCNRFPEYTGQGTCLTNPGCVEDLQARALSPRICDGILDCQDLSDEKSCSYCDKSHLHCGTTRICIPRNKRCDGKQDCPDGSDERACLSLASNVAQLQKVAVTTSHVTRYNPEGYVIFNEKGDMGKLCTENINRTLSTNSSQAVLRSVATSLCNSLTYRNVLTVQIEKDIEANVSYVKMKDPGAADITFVRSKCPSKQVLKVSCTEFDCGLQNNYNRLMPKPLAKMAIHGDWPWHAALYKEDVHICDATLVSADWLVTTTSCFQGQPKAEWTARFGTVRLTSSAPWEQERRIVGMVKSPVEGSNIALIKLDQPLVFNDFVRPICLPHANVILTSADQCNALGWARNRDQLQRVQVKVAEMQKCDNVSISNINSICTETYYGKNDCNEEEFAGSPMVCQLSNNSKWTLIGITNWRIACAKNGMERPRQYDKIMSNVKWIHDTIYDNNNAT